MFVCCNSVYSPIMRLMVRGFYKYNNNNGKYNNKIDIDDKIVTTLEDFVVFENE